MDCDHPTSNQHFARTERKAKRLKRKSVDLVDEEHELQPKDKQVKRRRTETKDKDMKPEKTETCVEAPCSAPEKQSKEESLKRKRMAVPHDGPEPQSKKMTRTEKEKRDFFNRYIVGELLGQGSFGFVYKGFRKSDGKKVALKLMRKVASDPHITLPGDTHSLPLEVALLELVCKPPRCPNVIEMLDWLETSKVCFLVLERPDPCVELFNYCNDVKISESQAKMIMRQIIQAACHCHDRGVFHRDIKEENILLNPQTFEVKLIDFGCGDLLKDAPYTEFAGTDMFQTPEWLTEQAYEAEPATVWSLGILLYSLLCGAEPFIKAEEIVDGRLYFPDYISEASCSLIRWCLQRDPKKRPTLEQVLTHNWF